MKIRHKYLSMCLLLALSVTSCGNNTKKIDLFLYDQNDTFISSLSQNISNSLDDNYKVTIHDAKKSQAIQNKQIINQLDDNNPDVLVVNAVDRLSSSSIIQKANKYQIPVIFFNREPVYNDIKPYGNAYYVGTNPIQEGKNQALMADRLMGSSKNINKNIDKNGDNKLQCVFIQGEAGHQDTEKRTWSCIEYLQELGYELEILAMDKANWNREKGKTTMASIYEKYNDTIEFVFSNNDDMALGAADFIIENNLNDVVDGKIVMPFPIVGVDGTEEGLKAIKDGLLYGTTINDSTNQAKAIVYLIKLLTKEITAEEFNKEFNFDEKKEKYIYLSGKIVYQNMK